MICPACGALGGPTDQACRACGAALADDDVTIVLHPPGAEPAQGIAASMAWPEERLVIELEDVLDPLPPPTGAPLPAPAPPTVPLQATPTVAYPEAPAPAPAPAPPAPWQPAPSAPVAPPAPPPVPPALASGDAPPPAGRGPRRLLLAGAISALLATLLLGGWLLLGRGSGDQDLAASALQAGQVRVTRFAERAATAKRLQALRRIGTEATQARSDLAAQEQAIAQIGDEGLRTAATQAASAQRAYLQAIGGLQQVTQSSVRRQGAPAAQAVVDGAARALRDLEQAQQALADRDLPGETQVDLDEARRASQAMLQTALGAGEQLRRFDQRLVAYERSVRRAAARAAVVVRYRDGVLATLNRYAQDRKAVDPVAARVDDMDYVDAAERFDGFKRDREAVISTIERTVPAAPLTASAAELHRALLVPLGTSLQGLDAAIEAISSAYGSDETVTSQPQWPSFQDSSDQVDQELASARGAWISFVNDLEARTRRQGVLPRPKAPDV